MAPNGTECNQMATRQTMGACSIILKSLPRIIDNFLISSPLKEPRLSPGIFKIRFWFCKARLDFFRLKTFGFRTSESLKRDAFIGIHCAIVGLPSKMVFQSGPTVHLKQKRQRNRYRLVDLLGNSKFGCGMVPRQIQRNLTRPDRFALYIGFQQPFRSDNGMKIPSKRSSLSIQHSLRSQQSSRIPVAFLISDFL